MKKIILCLLLICPLLVGCNNNNTSTQPSTSPNETNTHHPDPHHS